MLKKILKVLGVVVLILIVAAMGAAGYVVVKFNSLLDGRYTVQAHPVAVPSDAASLAEGRRLLKARACAECHGDDMSGKAFLDDPGLGRLYSANVTGGRGSRVSTYSDADLERIIRHAVRPDGSSVVFMPANELWYLGDEEVGRIIQAVRALPHVDKEQPANQPTFLMKALSVAGIIKFVAAKTVDPLKPHVAQPPPGITVEYGKHLAVACTGCHGEGFSGGRIPGAPPSIPVPANLTPAPDGLGRYSQVQFASMLRTGKRPDGTDINPFMPWKVYGHMTDDELKALYAFLTSLPPKPFGGR
jgi:cytochrome c553